MKRLILIFIICPVISIYAAITNSVPLDCTSFGTPAICDGFLYVPVEGVLSSGFAVFSLADPRTPKFVSFAQTLEFSPSSPLFYGDTAYISTRRGVELFDLTNPEVPVRLRIITPERFAGSPVNTEIKDSTLTLRISNTSYVYDLSDVFAPLLSNINIDETNQQHANPSSSARKVKEKDIGAATNDVIRNSVTNGAYSYVADSTCLSLLTYSIQNNELQTVTTVKPHVRIFELSNSNSQNVARNDNNRIEQNGKLLLSGNLLVAFAPTADATQDTPRAILTCFDITDTTSPHRLGSLEIDGYAKGICNVPETNLLFVADGFRINAVILNNDGTLTNMTSIKTSRNSLYGPQSVTVTDDGTILAACGTDNVKTYAFSGTNFEFKAFCATGGFANDIAYEKGYAYVADGFGGITRLNFKNGKLSNAKTFPLPLGSAMAIAVKDGTAYAACGELPIVSLVKAHPLPFANRASDSELILGAFACGISLFEKNSRRYAAVADSGNGATIFDITDPQHPVFMSAPLKRADGSQFAQHVLSVVNAGEKLFVLDAVRGLVVCDLPANL